MLTVDQAAELTGYSDAHLRLLGRKGKAGAVMIGRVYFFDKAALLTYKATARVGRPPDRTPYPLAEGTE
jgi:excisionase family DNA binding protein